MLYVYLLLYYIEVSSFIWTTVPAINFHIAVYDNDIYSFDERKTYLLELQFILFGIVSLLSMWNFITSLL